MSVTQHIPDQLVTGRDIGGKWEYKAVDEIVRRIVCANENLIKYKTQSRYESKV